MGRSKMRCQESEYLRSCKSDMIDKHLLESYNEIADGCRITDVDARIRAHRRLIHQLNMGGKNKYKTLGFLQQYRNTNNKALGHALLLSTLNNRGLFSKFLSDKERKAAHWSAKGPGYSDC